jgi:hypothetical protein
MMEATVTEPTAIEVSGEAASHKGKFFLIDASFLGNGRVPGIEIANEQKLIDPGMNVVSRPNAARSGRARWHMDCVGAVEATV